MFNFYEQVKSHSEKSIQTTHESAELIVSQIDRASKQLIEHAKQHAEFTKAHLDAALGFRDFNNVFQFSQNQVESSTQYLTEVGFEKYDLAELLQKEIKDHTDKQFDQYHSVLHQWTLENLEKCPPSAEPLVTMTKHAMDLTSTTINEIRNHVNQTSNVIADFVNHAKNQFYKPKATARSSRAKTK